MGDYGDREKAYQAAWYADNRERVKAQQAAYYAANREKIIARQKARYQAKKTEILPKQQAYKRANPEQYRGYAARYYAENPEPLRLRARLSEGRRRSQRSEGTLSTEEWAAILEEFDHCCAYCQVRGQKLTIEHVVPLSRGGRHDAANVVPACKSCNSSKGPKTLLEFVSLVPLKLIGVT